MKVLVSLMISSAFVLASASAMAGNYECYRYVDGKPTGGSVNVSASSQSEAVSAAMEKYRNLGLTTHSVNCHIK